MRCHPSATLQPPPPGSPYDVSDFGSSSALPWQVKLKSVQINGHNGQNGGGAAAATPGYRKVLKGRGSDKR